MPDSDPFLDIDDVRHRFRGSSRDSSGSSSGGHVGCVGHRTVINWIRDGVRVPSGERVKLRAVMLGGRWRIRTSSFEEFVRQIEAASSIHLQPQGV